MSTEAMEPFREVVTNLYNRRIREEKDAGNKIIGYFCSYLPAEIIYAAGAIPYRITGIPGRDIGAGTTYLSARTCTYCRNVLTLALENDLSFIDGVIGCNTCDQIRRATQNWMVKNPPSYHDVIHVPRAEREENISYFTGELISLKTGIEEWLNFRIRDDDLLSAIDLYNRGRKLLRELSELRRNDAPPISGAEMLTVAIAFHQMPIDDFIDAAQRLLESRRSATGRNGAVRVLVAGSLLDEPDYMTFVEEQGIDVVADPVCFGLRSYRDDVNVNEEPLTALSRRYLTHFPCARIGDSFPERLEAIMETYREYRADGIIFQKLKFCQLWGVDVLNMRPYCEEQDIPLLQLEREYGFFSTGQMKTRLQAFVELINARKEFD